MPRAHLVTFADMLPLDCALKARAVHIRRLRYRASRAQTFGEKLAALAEIKRLRALSTAELVDHGRAVLGGRSAIAESEIRAYTF